MDEVSDVSLDRQTEIRRTVTYFAWFIAGALGIWLLGLVIALPLLVFLYGLIEGKEKWLTALIMGACTYALVWGLSNTCSRLDGRPEFSSVDQRLARFSPARRTI
jgi:hypothetical protein